MKRIPILSAGAAILILTSGCATLFGNSTPPMADEFRRSFYREFSSPLLSAGQGRVDFAAFWCANRPDNVPPAEICED